MCTMSHFCPQCLPPCERRAGGLLRDAEGTPAGNYISTQQLIISFFFFIRCFDNVFRDIFVSFSLLYALFTPFPSSLVLFLSIRMAEIGKALSKGEKLLGCTNPLSFPSFSSSLNMGFYLMHIVFPLCMTI